MKTKYAVIDLETTGGIPKRDKITEIAIIVFDGHEVIAEFQSLVNPERAIPPHITRITGITNEMVEDAPRFYEIAKEVIELTESCVFVAHNVRFDYSFLTEEFKSLGYTYTRRNLCTVKLSRKAFPGLRSYSLGNLIKYFGIEVKNRHRAYDDAYATTILLEKIFSQQEDKDEVKSLVREAIKLTKLPKAISLETIENLPQDCGVYYFRDAYGEIVYIGKSKNIFQRVKQHFSKYTKKSDKLFQQVADIEYEITGSELISLIHESYEIKKHQPSINKVQKNKEFNYAIIQSQDKSGYYKYDVVTRAKAENALSYYSSRKSALQHIETISEHFELCLKVNGIDTAHDSCFKFGIQKCKGACIGQEMIHSYNERFQESTYHLNRLFNENFIIIEDGRSADEKAVVLVEDGHFKSYSYIPTEQSISSIEQIKDQFENFTFNPEADQLIRNYMWSNIQLKIIYF